MYFIIIRYLYLVISVMDQSLFMKKICAFPSFPFVATCVAYREGDTIHLPF